MHTQHVPDHGRQRQLHRYLSSVLILITLGVTTACGAQNASGPSTPAASTPSVTAPPSDAHAQWANSVCSAANDVRRSLDAIGTDLTLDPTAGADAREQIRVKLQTQVAATRTSIGALGTAIEAAPVDAEGAAMLKTSLGDARTSLEESIQTVSDGVTKTTAATTAREFATAGAQTLQAAKAASVSAQGFLTTAKDAATTAGGDMRAAFDSAPSCTPPSASPS